MNWGNDINRQEIGHDMFGLAAGDSAQEVKRLGEIDRVADF